MRSSRSSNEAPRLSTWRFRALAGILLSAGIVLGVYHDVSAPSVPNNSVNSTATRHPTQQQPDDPGVPGVHFTHTNITTTYFWIGEPADGDNGYIANAASAWDEGWQQHYGGTDDPSKRLGYRPAAFVPKENPFYVALPYSDITDDGARKASATGCPHYQALKNQPYSWCKNSWVAIRHAGKIAYAQWEDAGPFGTDDTPYVFGTARPQNQIDTKAGLDVSPAVRDYLKLGDVALCDWVFVDDARVPAGPWKQTITTDHGDSIS